MVGQPGTSGPPVGRNSPRSPGRVALGLALLAVAVAVPLATGAAGPPSAPAIDAATLQADEPTASLTVAPNPAHPGRAVTFDATNSSAGASGSVEGCAFDTTGDGSYDREAADCTINRSYAATGEYEVSVRVETTTGQTAFATATLSVRENEPPAPAIGVDPAAPTAGESVSLSAAGSSDPDGAVVSHEWSVDGEPATGETVETEFAAPGEYEIVLVVTDDDGATAETVEVLTVEPNEPPVASLRADATAVTVGQSVGLDASASTDPDGAVVAYRWDLDGDGAVDRRTEEPRTELTVDAAGRREVGVTVVDDATATDAATITLEVAPAATTVPPTTGGVDGSGETAAPDGSAPERGGLAAVLDRFDPGLVPLVPDWLVAVLLALVIGGVILHRREPIPARASRLRERIHEGEFRRSVAKKATGFLSKSAFKKVVRKLADGVEGSGEVVGEVFQRIGRAIKRGSKRVADALRSLGG